MEAYKNVIEKANLMVDEYNKNKSSFDLYNSELEQLKDDFAKNMPDIYGLHNLLLTALINELQNGNLDGELLIEAEKLLNKYYENLFVKVKDFSISFEDINALVLLSDEQLNNIFLELGKLISDPSENFGEYENSIQDKKIHSIVIGLKETFAKVSSLDEDSEEYKQWVDDAIKLEQIQRLVNYIKENRILFEPIKKLIDLQTNKTKFKINALYDFLRTKFDIYLDRNSKMSVMKIMNLLEQEDQKFKIGPSVDAYFYSGSTHKDIEQAVNTLNLLKTVIKGLSTTEVGYGDPYGVIASRQAFAKKHGIDAEVLKLKTLPSDIVTLMHQDIDRIITKLEFYLEVAKYNSNMLPKEQKLIQEKFDKLLLERW